MTTKKKDQGLISELMNDLHENWNEIARLYTRQDQIVRAMRKEGASWTQIGTPLFMTRQAAQQFFGRRVGSTPSVDEPEEADL